MTFADHFSSIAARYAAYRPTYPSELVDVLVERSPKGTAVDVGCGTGQLAEMLVGRFEHVMGVDPSEELICKTASGSQVEYCVASAEDTGLPNGCAALVVAAQAAHWFDWPKFTAEAARIAMPGALVALVSYGILVVEGDAANAIVARYYTEDVGRFWPKGREHVENGYRDLNLPWPAVDAPPLAMTATWTREELVGYLTTWSATVKMVAAKGTAPLEAISAALAAVWPDGETRTIRWPLTVKLARALQHPGV